MELASDRCSIVVVGAWNLAIFRPDWVGKRLFADEDEIQFGFDVASGSGTQAYFRSTRVWLAASAGRLEFKPVNLDDMSFGAIEESARAILNLLPETPIAACGINFGFDAPIASPLAAILALPDESALRAAAVAVSATKVARTVDFTGMRFNFVVEHEAGSELLKVDFNHHHQARSAQEARNLLLGKVSSSLDASRRFLDTIYLNPGASS